MNSVTGHRATYSPEDNKLRLYPAWRLSAEEYAQVKAAGFKWAPKQQLFVAPMWTPEREDLLLEWCEEIEDEDTSLVDRAEAKADRLEDLSERRRGDAQTARAAVDAIADGIPMGQPILVGHHSEKRARRDAQKIESGMRKAVRMWDLAEYWKDRAAGAIRHAKYKERADVRARRIKGLEADQRKHAKEKDLAESLLKFWTGSPPMEKALAVCNLLDHGGVFLPEGPHYWSAWSALKDERVTLEELRAQRLESLPHAIAHEARWLAHLKNRITYERAMLSEAGGTAADKWELQVGGRVLVHELWLTILKVNRTGETISSVSTNNTRWPRVVSVEMIRDYQPPTADQAEAVKVATKLPPMCNYPGKGFTPITQADWNKKHKDYKGSRVIQAADQAGAHRVRSGFFSHEGGYSSVLVFITDAPRKDPPKPASSPRKAPAVAPVSPDLPTIQRQAQARHQAQGQPKGDDGEPFRLMRDSIKAGVQTVSAPSLFPTPPDLAARMVNEAGITTGNRVLEPSAGTGNIMAEIGRARVACKAVAVEINQHLADGLRTRFMVNVDVRCADFMDCNGDLGTFDRIVMNPPFDHGADVKHIEHARKFLKPGGRLVALCANGPKQRERLKPAAEESGGWWEDLPAGTFEDAGTRVNVALLVIEG